MTIGESELKTLLIFLGLVWAMWQIWETWKRTRPCPHRIPGGSIAGKCGECEQERATAEAQRVKQAEQHKKSQRLEQELKTLKDREVARLASSLVPSLDDLRALSWQQFEDEIARMYGRLGYSVEQTPYVNDHGRDAILRKDGKIYLLECKRYGADKPSGRPEIQKFHGSAVTDKAVKGFFVTTGRFTPTAVDYARTSNPPIELIDGDHLLALMFESKKNSERQDDSYSSVCRRCGSEVVHRLRKPRDQPCPKGHDVAPTISVSDVFPAAGTPPACVKCGSTMRLVSGRNGKFWGCSGYPACRSTVPFRGTRKRKRTNQFSLSRIIN